MPKPKTDKPIAIPFIALKSFPLDVKRQAEKNGKTIVVSAPCEYVEGQTYTFRGDPEFRKQLIKLQAAKKVAVMGAL